MINYIKKIILKRKISKILNNIKNENKSDEYKIMKAYTILKNI